MQQKFNYHQSYWDTFPSDKMHCVVLPERGCKGLYIGNVYAASDRQLHLDMNICSILTVETKTGTTCKGNAQILYHKIIPVNMEDPGDLFKSFYDAYLFIENGFKVGNVLINCITGTVLSSVFAMSYLLYKYNCTVERAWDLVKSQNPFAKVRHEYFTQLLQLEQSLNLDIYLGPKPQLMKTEIDDRQLTPLEKLRLRDEKRKEYVQNCYSQYAIDSHLKIDYDELRQRYPKNT